MKITKIEKKLGKNSMQKFPNLSFKTVKKFGQKSSKIDIKSSKNFLFVVQNRKKSDSKRDQNLRKLTKNRILNYSICSFKNLKNRQKFVNQVRIDLRNQA